MKNLPSLSWVLCKGVVHRDREFKFTRFGFWIRFYTGSTSSPKRVWRWRFNGVKHQYRGFTLRLKGENCIGVQWVQGRQ